MRSILVSLVSVWSILLTTSTLVDAHDLSSLSNGERLRRGLAPRKPSRLFDPSRSRTFNARAAAISGKPTQTEKGYLYALQPGQAAQGCMISNGDYFIGGTCATYTQTTTGDEITLSASKGPCAINSDGFFRCDNSYTATVFTLSADGDLQYDGSPAFSTPNIPPANTRQQIYAGSGEAVPVRLQFVAGTATSSSASSSSTSSTSSSAAFPTGTGLTVCSKDASSYPLSCSGATGQDTCCYDTPGGHMLQTQFWDTGSTSTGPNNSWTVHGLWPDDCDGSYDQFCDPSRESSDIRGVLSSAGQTDLLSYMDNYWKDYQGNDESFWEHEWNKHGTCMSSLEPTCFNNYTRNQEIVTFFNRCVDLFKGLPTYDWLAQSNIYPSTTKTYTLDQIQGALSGAYGHPVNVNCDKNGVFDEVWYHYDTQGGVASGNFVPVDPVGSPSTCPATGIKYYPKYVDLTATPTTSASPSGSGSGSPSQPSSTSIVGIQPTVGERGFLYPVTSDGSAVSGTCLINAGVWFQGTCGGYHVQGISNSTGGDAFQLYTNGGLCEINDSVLRCAKDVTVGAEFTATSDGVLSYQGSNQFSAAKKPSGQDKEDIHTDGSQDVKLTLVFAAAT